MSCLIENITTDLIIAWDKMRGSVYMFNTRTYPILL